MSQPLPGTRRAGQKVLHAGHRLLVLLQVHQAAALLARVADRACIGLDLAVDGAAGKRSGVDLEQLGLVQSASGKVGEITSSLSIARLAARKAPDGGWYLDR